MNIRAIALRGEHIAVIVAMVIVGAMVLFLSGDVDPLFAIESGLGVGLVTYLAAYLRSRGLFSCWRSQQKP